VSVNDATFDLMNIHEIPYMENDRMSLSAEFWHLVSVWVILDVNFEIFLQFGRICQWRPPEPHPKRQNLWSGFRENTKVEKSIFCAILCRVHPHFESGDLNWCDASKKKTTAFPSIPWVSWKVPQIAKMFFKHA
jgi:hypothetical protein